MSIYIDPNKSRILYVLAKILPTNLAALWLKEMYTKNKALPGVETIYSKDTHPHTAKNEITFLRPQPLSEPIAIDSIEYICWRQASTYRKTAGVGCFEAQNKMCLSNVALYIVAWQNRFYVQKRATKTNFETNNNH